MHLVIIFAVIFFSNKNNHVFQTIFTISLLLLEKYSGDTLK